jgi:hypothetical protein
MLVSWRNSLKTWKVLLNLEEMVDLFYINVCVYVIINPIFFYLFVQDIVQPSKQHPKGISINNKSNKKDQCKRIK